VRKDDEGLRGAWVSSPPWHLDVANSSSDTSLSLQSFGTPSDYQSNTVLETRIVAKLAYYDCRSIATRIVVNLLLKLS
jgi:cephalosporin-C deacetylase-like acetyl esterase